jgi:hypothetical protein
MTEPDDKDTRTWTEEVEISAATLVESIKKLVAEGNVRRLIIKKPDGEALIEIPLTAGVAIGGAMVLIAPVLAAIGALAALLTKVKIVIVRASGPADKPGAKPPE